ncbi:MAG: hypothetical protein ABIR81_00765 [Ginsengibacter sp.]
MKCISTILFSLFLVMARAQKIDNLYVNLYTDSLKKGTYNYINVDGKLADGHFTPLDSTEVIFWASDGIFFGNSLFIDRDFKKPHVLIKVCLRKNPKVNKEFTMFIKTKEDNEKLKTDEEILNDLKNSSKKKKKEKNIV